MDYFLDIFVPSKAFRIDSEWVNEWSESSLTKEI